MQRWDTSRGTIGNRNVQGFRQLEGIQKTWVRGTYGDRFLLVSLVGSHEWPHSEATHHKSVYAGLRQQQ